jgi:hypothetical protein
LVAQENAAMLNAITFLDIFLVSVTVIGALHCAWLISLVHKANSETMHVLQFLLWMMFVGILAILAFDFLYFLNAISIIQYSNLRRIPGRLLISMWPTWCVYIMLYKFSHER